MTTTEVTYNCTDHGDYSDRNKSGYNCSDNDESGYDYSDHDKSGYN